MRHDCLTGADVHHIGTHAEDTARRDCELQLHAVVHKLHLRHLAFVNCYELDDLARALFRRVYRQLLYRLTFDAVNLFDDNLRLTYLQFVSFATHRLNQHAQMQHTTAVHCPRRLFVAGLHAQGEVLLQLFGQTLLDMSGSDVLAVLSEERAVVDGEHHRHRRFVNGDRVECFRVLDVADGVTYLEAFYTN